MFRNKILSHLFLCVILTFVSSCNQEPIPYEVNFNRGENKATQTFFTILNSTGQLGANGAYGQWTDTKVTVESGNHVDINIIGTVTAGGTSYFKTISKDSHMIDDQKFPVKQGSIIHVTPGEYSKGMNYVKFSSQASDEINTYMSIDKNMTNTNGIGVITTLNPENTNYSYELFPYNYTIALGYPYGSSPNPGHVFTVPETGLMSFRIHKDVHEGNYNLSIGVSGSSIINGGEKGDEYDSSVSTDENGLVQLKLATNGKTCNSLEDESQIQTFRGPSYLFYPALSSDTGIKIVRADKIIYYPVYTLTEGTTAKLCMRIFMDSEESYKNSSGNYTVKLDYTKFSGGWASSSITQMLLNYILGGFSNSGKSSAYATEKSAANLVLNSNAISNALTANSAGIYQHIIQDYRLPTILKVAASMSVFIYALLFVTGAVQHKLSDTLKLVAKIALIMSVLNPVSWKFFYENAFIIFFEGTNKIIAVATGGDTTSKSTFFFIDNILSTMLNFDLLSGILKIDLAVFITMISVVFSASQGFVPILFIFALYFAVMFLLMTGKIVIRILGAMFQVLIQYTQSMILTGFLTCLTPLFIICLLFKKTQGMFDKWINLLFYSAFSPILATIGMSFLFDIYFDILQNILTFKASLSFKGLEFHPVIDPFLSFITIVPHFDIEIPMNVDAGVYILYLFVNLIILDILTTLAPSMLNLFETISALLAGCSPLFVNVKNDVQRAAGKDKKGEDSSKDEGKDDKKGDKEGAKDRGGAGEGAGGSNGMSGGAGGAGGAGAAGGSVGGAGGGIPKGKAGM